MKSYIIIVLFLTVLSARAKLTLDTLGIMLQLPDDLIKQCVSEAGATDGDLKLLSTLTPPLTRPAKCMVVCLVKGIELEFGKDFIKDKFGNAEKIKNEDPEAYKAYLGVIGACMDEVPPSDDKCEYLGTFLECKINKIKALN